MLLGIVLRRIAKILLWSVLTALLVVGITLGVFRWRADLREVVVAADAAPRSGRFVHAHDVQLYIQEEGPADGEVVILMHGTGAWSGTWRHTQSELANNGYRAIALDLPPFGFSERSASMSYTKASQGRRIMGLLDELGIQKAILVGHSFGAGPTVEAALLKPERISKLVIVDGALSIREDIANGDENSFSRRALSAALHVRPLSEGVVATFISNPSFTRKLIQSFVADPASVTDEYVFIYQRPIPVKGGTAAVAAWLPELLVPMDLSRSEDPSEYRALSLPTTLIWGKADTITPIEQAHRLQTLIPRVRLVELENVGHIPQIEGTKAFNRALIDALKNTSSAKLQNE